MGIDGNDFLLMMTCHKYRVYLLSYFHLALSTMHSKKTITTCYKLTIYFVKITKKINENVVHKWMIKNTMLPKE